MAARKLSVGDAIVAQAALEQIIGKLGGDIEDFAKGILTYAADVQYKPVTGTLTVTFDLSGPELVPAKPSD